MSAPDCFIDHLAVVPGELGVSVDESWKAGRLRTDAVTFRASGFEHHFLADASTDALELALRACREVGDALPGTGTIIYSTAIPLNSYQRREQDFARSRDIKDLSDFPASRLQAALGLEQASVVGLTQQACTAMLGSIRLARALLSAEPDLEQVLCVSADRFPPGAIYEQAYNLVSDAACAAIVSRKPAGYRIVACHAITNGALAQASDDEMAGTHFAYAHQIIHETVARAGLTLGDIDWIVPQNTTPKVWQILSRVLKHPLDRVAMDTVARVGHAISSDNILNLIALEQSGRLKPGDRLLLFMASFGMNWQGLVLEKVGPV